MTRPAVDLLTDALAALPTEPDEIADLFAELGIKGKRRDPCGCPVANYLKAEMGLGYVRTDRVTVRAGDRETDLPWHVRRFVFHFDLGRYPHLVEATS